MFTRLGKILDHLKGFLSGVAFYVGLYRLFLYCPKRGFKAVILMYHNIIAGVSTNLAKDHISMRYFKKQIGFIKKYFPIIRLEDLADMLKKQDFPVKRAVVLTFDDGYRTFFTEVAGFLKQEKVKVTLFPAKIFLNKEGYISEEEMQKLSSFVDIGAHTLTHPFFADISLEEAKKEIAGSKEYLEEKLLKQICLFCYPRGKREDLKKELDVYLKETGFKCACTSEEGIITSKVDPYRLPRISPRAKSLARFAVRLCFLLR